MKTLSLLAALLFAPIYSESTCCITHADQVTEELLSTPGPFFNYTEHVRHFKIIFDQMKVRTFLEFGVGFSTKYFLENSERVISVEFVTNGTGPEWFIYCMQLFQEYRTWMPIAYLSRYDGDARWARYQYKGLDSVHEAAAYQPVHLKSYKEIDPSFLDDLDNFILQQSAGSAIDVAFVDAGVCLRGDLVQLLFNKVPIIVAHDFGPQETIALNDLYGYGRIIVPDNYTQIIIPDGMGTAFWIVKEEKYQQIIQDLTERATLPM